MTESAKAGFKGLITAVAETSSDIGALRVADNVVLRRQGALMPRQGFVPDASPAGAPGKTLLASHVRGNLTLYEFASANSGFLSTSGSELSLVAQYTFPAPASSARLRSDIRDSAALRGSLYVPFGFGVAKIVEGTTLGYAGIPPAVYTFGGVSTTSTATNILPANSQVAYRLVGKRTDATGLIVRSRPSGAVLVTNPSGAAVTPLVGWASNSIFPEVEIYRTRVFPLTAQVDDEMQLVTTVGGGSATFFDQVLDINRGVTLYTSPSRGGIESANDAPPACACIEAFKQSMFFGNVRGPARIVLNYNWAGTIATASGVGFRSPTATFVAGQSQLTAVSSTTGLERGMVLCSFAGSGSVAYPVVWITNIAGNVITLSGTPAMSSATGVATFADSVELDGVWYPLLPNGSIGQYTSGYGTAAYGSFGITPAAPPWNTTTVFERAFRDVPANTAVRATHGGEFYPPLPVYGAAQTADGTTKQDVYPNGINWTPPDEPEHCPPKYSALVGDKGKAILGMVAMRDAMFIVKEDGIWRLTGVNGNFTITAFDMTTFCILPSSIRRLDNQFYMLSNKGLVQVDDNGVTVLSEPIRPQVARLIDDVRTNFAANGVYSISGMAGTASAVDSRNNEYLLSMGTTAPDFGGDALVYNALTGAFSTFSFNKAADAFGFTPSGYGMRHDDALQVLHTGGVRIADYAQLTLGGELLPMAADGVLVITLSSVTPNASATQATLVYTPSALLAVGDVIARSGSYYRVASVTNATTVVVNINTSNGFSYPAAPPTGSAAAYRAITCTMQPQGFATPELQQKLWTHGTWALSRLVGTTQALASFTSATPSVNLAASAITEQLVIPYGQGYARHTAGVLLRQPIPMPHRRGWLLRLQLTLSLAFGEFLLEIVGVESRDDSTNRIGTHGTGAT